MINVLIEFYTICYIMLFEKFYGIPRFEKKKYVFECLALKDTCNPVSFKIGCWVKYMDIKYETNCMLFIFDILRFFGWKFSAQWYDVYY